jgi:hypothetical protein
MIGLKRKFKIFGLAKELASSGSRVFSDSKFLEELKTLRGVPLWLFQFFNESVVFQNENSIFIGGFYSVELDKEKKILNFKIYDDAKEIFKEDLNLISILNFPFIKKFLIYKFYSLEVDLVKTLKKRIEIDFEVLEQNQRLEYKDYNETFNEMILRFLTPLLKKGEFDVRFSMRFYEPSKYVKIFNKPLEALIQNDFKDFSYPLNEVYKILFEPVTSKNGFYFSKWNRNERLKNLLQNYDLNSLKFTEHEILFFITYLKFCNILKKKTDYVEIAKLF